jgi:hypothetical protein
VGNTNLSSFQGCHVIKPEKRKSSLKIAQNSGNENLKKRKVIFLSIVSSSASLNHFFLSMAFLYLCKLLKHRRYH